MKKIILIILTIFNSNLLIEENINQQTNITHNEKNNSITDLMSLFEDIDFKCDKANCLEFIDKNYSDNQKENLKTIISLIPKEYRYSRKEYDLMRGVFVIVEATDTTYKIVKKTVSGYLNKLKSLKEEFDKTKEEFESEF